MDFQDVSDAFPKQESSTGIMTPEDLVPFEVGYPKIESRAKKLGDLAATAVDMSYGIAEDPYQAYADNINLTPEEQDMKAGQYLIDYVVPELDPRDTQSIEIGTMLYEDSAKPGISDQMGLEEVAGTPEGAAYLKQRKKVLEFQDSINQKHNGFWDVAWEVGKTVLIPGRDALAAKEIFGTYFTSGVENFVNVYRSAKPEKQRVMFAEIMKNIEKTDGFWMEKMAYVDLLTSNSADEDLDLTHMGAVMDMAFVAGDLAAVAKMRKFIKGKSDIAKAVEEAQNVPLAGRLQADAIVDPDVAKVTGVNPDQAVADVMTGAPTANAVLSNLPTGGAHQTDASIAFRKELDRTQQEIKDLLRPETFDGKETWDEIDKISKETIESIEKTAGHTTTEQPEVKLLSATADGEVEIEISYKLPAGTNKLKKNGTYKLKKDGTPKKHKKPVQGVTTVKKQLTTTAWGSLEKTNAGDVSASLLNLKSPKMKLEGTTGKGTTVSRTVEEAGLVVNAQARINKDFNEAFRVATKGSKKSRTKVNKLLTEQDKIGKRLSPDEILALDPKITQKEMDSYYMVDELFDVMKVFEDDMTWVRGKLVGAEEYNLGTGSLGFGRSFDSTSDNFLKALDETHHTRDNAPTEYWDNDLGKMIPSQDVNAHLAAKGKRIVVLDKDDVMSSGNKHRVVIVDEKNIRPLQRESVGKHRVEGYVPRIRQNAKYFLDEVVEEVVDGKTIQRRRLYAASSKKSEIVKAHAARKAELEAEQSANKALPKNERNPVLVKSVDDWRYDGEGGGFSTNDMAPTTSNSLFLGHRATHDIQWLGSSGELDPPDMALAKNLAYVARTFPLNEWRMKQETKWKNSVREAGITDNPDLRVALPNDTAVGSAEARLLEEHRRYLRSALGVPDGDTNRWENFTIGVSEMFDDKGKLGDAIGRGIRRNSNFNVATELKYLAFHSLLGWFNPSQLIVQASNMATAMSIHPWLTTRHMNKAMALRAGLYGSSSSVRRAVADKISGVDADELDDLILQFKRSGADIVTNNADMAAAVAGYGTTRATYRKIQEAGLVAYQQGELAGRSVTYTVAREAYMRDSNIKSWKDLKDPDHARIKEYFDNLSINLGKENNTNFQSHWGTSISTQFMHVTTKFVEQFFGKKFTPLERARLILGQGVLFGAAGLPFGEQMAKMYENAFREPDGSSGSLIPSDVIRNGMVNFITGDVALSNRVGLGNQATETLLKALDSDNTPMWQKAMGASGTLLGRGTYAATILESFAPWSVDMIKEDSLMRVGKAIAGLTSTGNNAEAAYIMYKHRKFISKTRGSYNYDSPTMQEIWGKALGFQSHRELDTWRAGKAVVDRQKWLTGRVDVFFKLMYNAGLDAHTAEYAKQFQDDIVTFSQIESGADDHDAGAIQKAIWKRIKDPKDKYTQNLNKVLKDHMSGKHNPELITKALKGS